MTDPTRPEISVLDLEFSWYTKETNTNNKTHQQGGHWHARAAHQWWRNHPVSLFPPVHLLLLHPPPVHVLLISPAGRGRGGRPSLKIIYFQR